MAGRSENGAERTRQKPLGATGGIWSALSALEPKYLLRIGAVLFCIMVWVALAAWIF